MSFHDFSVYVVNHPWNRAHTGVAWDVVIVDHEPQTQHEWDYVQMQLMCRIKPGGIIMLVEDLNEATAS